MQYFVNVIDQAGNSILASQSIAINFTIKKVLHFSAASFCIGGTTWEYGSSVSPIWLCPSISWTFLDVRLQSAIGLQQYGVSRGTLSGEGWRLIIPHRNAPSD